MNTDILMFEGEKIDLKLIKERHKKYDMFPTPWGKMTLWYLTYRIDYLRNKRKYHQWSKLDHIYIKSSTQ